ncbi:FxsA family protein [Haloplanus sp. GCM10025708]|uniref:FxsA family protein n=1 Tax=Haloferacaceae TaxID=1644056 RepID=UPI0036147A4B
MRLRWLFVLLLLIPLSDALLLVLVADAVGWQVTVALVVLTGLLGMLLVRAEGRYTLQRLQEKLARGDVPTTELMDGGMLIAAGAFLLTPGLVTDTLGFLLAVPITRAPIRAVLRRFVVQPYLDRRSGGFVTGRVWTAGFPDDDYGDDVYDVDGGSYSVDDDAK